MDNTPSDTPQAAAERLARDFLERVWSGRPDLDAIDQLMSEDYELSSAGDAVRGRAAFRQWVADFQQRLTGARNEVTDVFACAAGDRVAARWICSGRNAGVFGLPADGRRLHFSGLSIWAVRDGRLSRCWVERSPPRFDD